MNPLIKKTVEKISSHIDIDESQKMGIALVIGDAISEALIAAKENPNYNMKGGDSIDCDTIGNFKTGGLSNNIGMK